MFHDDGVVLTEHEQLVLAGIAATLDDPWLAHQLAGADGPPPAPARPGWLAPALLILGAFVAIAAFTRWWWVGGVGLVLMGVGAWLIWRHRPHAAAAHIPMRTVRTGPR